MASIDNRLVEMQFDNAAFERKVATTIQSLDQLQKSLDVAGATKGLADLDRASKSFNLGGVGTALDGLSTKFLALSTIGITVLANIADRAVDAGIRIGKALSIDQVIGGFQEYQTNINSIQTILANTKADGTNLQQVNDALDILNEYSDKTIYNFGEMTRNIGTFTAAGVDLDTSVGAIKGIANLAAISGSNSQQASTAMYQLSQAISSGTVRLMDWNSVVNAGMGGEVFQRALFETGKTMGTIADVDMATTFDDWTKAGNSFRGSLEDGWLTADVLTTTLRGFTGEMTDAELQAIGFNEEQIRQIQELGATGVDAATKVRTLTQLIGTVKEAIGSGWSQSFRIIFGDFNEATELFSNVSDAIGKMVSNSSDARNEVLQGWKDMGGRKKLIDGLGLAFLNLSDILFPIKEAFKDVFPPITATTLKNLTNNFYDFAEALRPNEATLTNLHRIFEGLFGALEIGWTVIKEGAGFFKDLFVSVTGAGNGNFLDNLAKIGDFLTQLNSDLVQGQGIKRFFDDLAQGIRDPGPYLEDLKNKFVNFIKSIDWEGILPTKLLDGLDRLQQRFETLKKVGEKIGDIWKPIKDKLQSVFDVFTEVKDYIVDWFKNLGSDMAAAAEPGDFDAVVDVVNVGLLGGIAAILTNFFKNGINLDFGGGVMEQIKNTFEGLTGVLKAMQTDIKANALLKIAAAIGVITLSVTILASIDSAALTRSLTALAVGFGQLVAAFVVINSISSGPKGAASFTTIAAGIIALSVGVLLLSVAVKNMAGLDWQELGKGLTGVTALLAILASASEVLAENSSGMIRAGIGIIGLSIALNLMALAVRQFGSMNWEELGKGLGSITALMLVLTQSVETLSKNSSGMVKVGASMILIGIAMNILALAVRQFADMSWEELGKGFAATAAGLLLITSAMDSLPDNMMGSAIGLLVISGALILIAKAMSAMAELSWEELAKGLLGMTAALLVLTAAADSMTEAIFGAVAIGVMAGSLLLLAEALERMGGMSLKEIGKGLLGIVVVIAALALASVAASSAVPAMIALGIALVTLGAGFALFGIGAQATAKAFEVLAKSGKAGITVLVELIDQLILRIPAFAKAMAVGMIDLANTLLEAAPVLIEQLGVVLVQLLDTVIELAPKLAEALGVLIDEGLQLIRDKAPDIIATGYQVITNLLTGLRDNIGPITELAAEIITNFLNGLANQIGSIVDAAVNLITEFVNAISNRMSDIVGLGVQLLTSFLQGIADNISKVLESAGEIIKTLIDGIVGLHLDIINAGVDALVKFLKGITDNLSKVTTAVTQVITKFISEVGGAALKIAQAGIDLLVDFLTGITDNLVKVTNAVGDMIAKFITAIGDNADKVITAGVDTVISFIEGLGKNAVKLANAALDVVVDFINGIADAIDSHNDELRDAGLNMAYAIVDGMTFGLADKAGDVVSGAKDLAGKAGDAIGSVFGIHSPSRLTRFFGQMVGEGLALGIGDNTSMTVQTASNMGSRVTQALSAAMRDAATTLDTMGEFNPIITPVLDLSQVQKKAAELAYLTDTSSSFTTDLSYRAAKDIATTDISTATVDTVPVVQDVKYEQNIYSPTKLATVDIYRGSRSLLRVAKEELGIPA